MPKTLIEEVRDQFDWIELVENCKDPDNRFEEEGELRGQTFLGTVFALMPSGKYYTSWANGNVTEAEAIDDEAYMEALKAVASEHGLIVMSGEGDPCDLFVGMTIDRDEEDEE